MELEVSYLLGICGTNPPPTRPLCRASPLQTKTLFTTEAPFTKIHRTHELTPLSRSLVQEAPLKRARPLSKRRTLMKSLPTYRESPTNIK
eukprot:3678260-Amphidinium_carterae.1